MQLNYSCTAEPRTIVLLWVFCVVLFVCVCGFWFWILTRILQRILTFLLQTYRAYLQELEKSSNPSQAAGVASPYASGSSPGFLLRLKYRTFILLTP